MHVEKYTVIPIMLDDTLNSKTAHIGQKFETHCTEPAGGFPKNTTFVGVITEARPSGGGEPGLLAGKYVEAVLPTRQRIPIEAMPSTKDGTKITSKSGSKKKKGRTGKGAIGGALVGGVIGGDLTGALAGGAAGAVVGKAATGKTRDLEIKAGKTGYIVLTQSVSLPG